MTGGATKRVAPCIEGFDGANDGRAHGTPTGDAATGKKGHGDGAPGGLQLAAGQAQVEVGNDGRIREACTAMRHDTRVRQHKAKGGRHFASRRALWEPCGAGGAC